MAWQQVKMRLSSSSFAGPFRPGETVLPLIARHHPLG
jgi:hypothetical protein